MLKDYSSKWYSFTGIALIVFCCYLDYTIVNIALPTIQREFATTLTRLQWIMNIYFLALCILATIMGRCGDLYGRRRMFYVGMTTFAIASLLAGFAHSIDWLIFGRLLQGIGAALIIPLGPSLLPEIFPPEQSAKSIAWLGSLGGIALALGPVLGGYIVSYWGWRWVFFINIPIIILGFIFCVKFVEESIVATDDRKLDLPGMFLLMLTMGGIVLSLIHSQTYGWTDGMTLTFLFVGILSGIFLYKIENHKQNPLIDFEDFSKLLFYSGAMICFLAGMLSAVALFFDPLYLQVIKGQTPEFSGLVLFAIPVAVFVVAFFVGWLIHHVGIINTIIMGMILSVLAGLFQVFFTEITSLWYIIISFLILGGMWALGNTVSIIAGQAAVDKSKTSAATGTIVTMFNVGGSIGLAISVVIFNWMSHHFLKNIAQANFTEEEMMHLQQSVDNPMHSLQIPMTDTMHSVFNSAFMYGFTKVMWFLFFLSAVVLISVILGKINKKGESA